MPITPRELYWILLQPSTVVLLFLAVGCLTLFLGWLRIGRALVLLALAITALPAVLPIRDALALPLESHVPVPHSLPERVDGIIVLGGAVDWRVTNARRQLNTDETAERLMAGAALARRYPDAQLVLTGIFGDTLANEFRPTGDARSYFAGPEFARGRVLHVGDARSTLEDATLTAARVQPAPGDTWILVTSAMHMPRALGVFQSTGWDVLPYPVDHQTTGRLELRPTPDAFAALVALDRVVREWGALVVYQMTGRTDTLLPAVTRTPAETSGGNTARAFGGAP